MGLAGAGSRGAGPAEERYFAELVKGNPLMSALAPGSGLLGGDYRKGIESDSGHFLHLSGARLSAGDGGDGLWRIRLDEVDAWTLHAMDGAGRQQDDKGPFARLLSGA